MQPSIVKVPGDPKKTPVSEVNSFFLTSDPTSSNPMKTEKLHKDILIWGVVYPESIHKTTNLSRF